MCFELSLPLHIGLESEMNFLGCIPTMEPLTATFSPTETCIAVKLNDAITSASC